MSAEKLRAATKRLRKLAEDTQPGPWVTEIACSGMSVAANGGYHVTPIIADRHAAYIAAMNPVVGLALADWLDREAENAEWVDIQEWNDCGLTMLRVAGLILGDPS